MADIVFPGEVAGALNSDAMPVNSDMVIYKGDAVDLYVTITDAGGTPISITGSTPKAQLKKSYDDYAPVDFTCTLTGVTGQVHIVLSTQACSTLAPGAYIWDFQLTNALGQTRTYLAGDVTVYNEVTQ